MKFLDGSYYEGEFLNNEIHGQGNLSFTKVSTSGARTGSMRASGKTTRCMATERPSGPMAGSMRDSMTMTRNTESVLSTGQMDGSIMEPGS